MITELYNDLVSRLPPSTPIYLGRQHLAQHDRPPRIVLYPLSERFAPPDRPQPQPGRVMALREVTLEMQIWGDSHAQVETVLAEVITALSASLGTSAQLQTLTWEPEGWDQLGVAAAFSFTVTTPVIRTERFAVLEEIAQKCAGFIS